MLISPYLALILSYVGIALMFGFARILTKLFRIHKTHEDALSRLDFLLETRADHIQGVKAMGNRATNREDKIRRLITILENIEQSASDEERFSGEISLSLLLMSISQSADDVPLEKPLQEAILMESDLTLARNQYNLVTSGWNELIGECPNNIVGGALGLTKKPLFLPEQHL